MASRSRKDASGKTLADKELDNFISWIAREIYNWDGLGTKNVKIPVGTNKIDAWMDLHEWNENLEKFIIDKSKLYIRLLNTNPSNSTNLQFIKALANRMAMYLSEFCQQGPNRSKSRARKILMNALYKNNSYIRGLELYQQNRRENKEPFNKQAYIARKRNDRSIAMREKQKTEYQVNVLFIEAARYRKH